jgi:hypothetical protein
MADADELDRNARDLLAAHRQHSGPSPEAAARLLAALRDSAAQVRPRSRSRPWTGVAIVGLLAAAVVVALRLAPESVAPRSRDANTAAPHSADGDAALPTRQTGGAAVEPPRSEPVLEDSLPEPARTSPRSEPIKRRQDPPAPPGDSLALELAFMREVNVALASGAPQQALDLLGGYPGRFPGGLLREESEALRALAGCNLRLDDASKLVAAAFVRAHPASMSLQRVRSACAL